LPDKDLNIKKKQLIHISKKQIRSSSASHSNLRRKIKITLSLRAKRISSPEPKTSCVNDLEHDVEDDIQSNFQINLRKIFEPSTNDEDITEDNESFKESKKRMRSCKEFLSLCSQDSTLERKTTLLKRINAGQKRKDLRINYDKAEWKNKSIETKVQEYKTRYNQKNSYFKLIRKTWYEIDQKGGNLSDLPEHIYNIEYKSVYTLQNHYYALLDFIQKVWSSDSLSSMNILNLAELKEHALPREIVSSYYWLGINKYYECFRKLRFNDERKGFILLVLYTNIALQDILLIKKENFIFNHTDHTVRILYNTFKWESPKKVVIKKLDIYLEIKYYWNLLDDNSYFAVHSKTSNRFRSFNKLKGEGLRKENITKYLSDEVNNLNSFMKKKTKLGLKLNVGLGPRAIRNIYRSHSRKDFNEYIELMREKKVDGDVASFLGYNY